MVEAAMETAVLLLGTEKARLRGWEKARLLGREKANA
jgi:hypothetical protein